MEEIRTHARLVDPAASSAFTHGVSTLVPRAEIEEVLHRGEYPAPLFLDIAHAGGDRSGGEVTAHARLMVEWDEPTLQELLRTTSGDSDIRLSFDADELERTLEESDVEAHGLKEKMAVLAVAAAAAGAGAGAAAAGPQVGMITDGGGSSANTPAAVAAAHNPDSNPLGQYVAGVDTQAAAQTSSFTSDVASGGTGSPAGVAFTSDVASGGTSAAAPDAVARYVANTGGDIGAATAPDAVARYVANTGGDIAAPAAGVAFTSDVASGGTGSAPDAVARYVANTGGDIAAPAAATDGSSISLPSPGEGAGIAAGIVLLITGAGFVAVRSRRPPELPA